MTASTLEVGTLFSIPGARGIERQLQGLAGVGSVSVNSVSGSTNVAYDTAQTYLSINMTSAQLFLIAKNGIWVTGMPAWSPSRSKKKLEMVRGS